MSEECVVTVGSDVPVKSRNDLLESERKGVARGSARLDFEANESFDDATKDLMKHALSIGANLVNNLQIVEIRDDAMTCILMYGDAWYVPGLSKVSAAPKGRAGYSA